MSTSPQNQISALFGSLRSANVEATVSEWFDVVDDETGQVAGRVRREGRSWVIRSEASTSYFPQREQAEADVIASHRRRAVWKAEREQQIDELVAMSPERRELALELHAAKFALRVAEHQDWRDYCNIEFQTAQVAAAQAALDDFDRADSAQLREVAA